MSEMHTMKPDRFSELADAFGGELSRWPSDEQARAQAFLSAEPELAQALLDEAAALDALLDLDVTAPPAPALYETIAASGIRRAFAPPRWAGIAAAIALMCGAGTGWLGAQMNTPTNHDALYANAFSVLSETETLFEDGS
ncbi:MAG: hypothetical protein CMH91_09750 [Oceanicaulis sp.]|uniref:hypothetical protein n=1 Tax=unclassified Oceanicaulis TaxID=2632123 RepID=UPI000C4FE759|nr:MULTISPECIES: hypothetical protein [unclassified Oceanicaulis]MAB69316.1 hypothetical protein [Oceanicaulis sp.]MBC39327.1 hypothetical protein [Oceanicaulis sp.]MBG35188.1 hypothetical protein [Oceanicaulis sp.]HBU62841.1 hypothetical protein [Oceanicaulis sp.]HCR94598.1 hypothetical protein [Oceanicaulis sp.]|tara:strand:+ start:66 stop:485 length:420 start_codon:yes stop_codon:yes gene_type:complete